MRRALSVFALLLVGVTTVQAHGLLIPEEKKLPPLAMVNHQVTIGIEDQVATTTVEQTFRNHTSRMLEATYVFPVPKGASVNKFSMWVNGKEVKGELVEAKKAREIYTSIVRRYQDPGLLEHVGDRLFKMRVFPIPPRGDQKVKLSYTSVSEREKDLVQLVYPLKTNGKATETLEKFSITATIKSQHGVQNVYSPTHSISLNRVNDKEVKVSFDKEQGLLDRDFSLYYQLSDKDVGLTALTHRPITDEDGYFLMLIAPKVELSEKNRVPRDFVLVLDTSGSMRGEKIEQAKTALKYCLDQLGPNDRFAVVNFATTINKYREELTPSGQDHVAQAKKWIDKLQASGGTAIHTALQSALDLRGKDESRTFTVVFFTDGLPTVGETEPAKILDDTMKKNSASTRIFTFGVGNDVNATLLDQLADKTRALTSYVRPKEKITTKVSSLYKKISHPVLTNLKIETTKGFSLAEVYPAQLPDLFHDTQLTVLGRYDGSGSAAITLTGMVGKEKKEFVYEMTFPKKTADEKDFVEHLWARRKVGFLLDQIRANGEKKELVEEATLLAKKYGITTPYTSYLIVPDNAVPVVRSSPRPAVGFRGAESPPALDSAKRPGGVPGKVIDFAKGASGKPGELAEKRNEELEAELRGKKEGGGSKGGDDKGDGKALEDAKKKKDAFDEARRLLRGRDRDGVQQGKLGVDLSLATRELRDQERLTRTALREANGRRLMEIGGVWIDEGFKDKMKPIIVKAMSDAYFRILERHPKMKHVFKLGNHLVWVTPSGDALVIDANDGKEKLSDKEIDQLFVAKK